MAEMDAVEIAHRHHGAGGMAAAGVVSRITVKPDVMMDSLIVRQDGRNRGAEPPEVKRGRMAVSVRLDSSAAAAG